MIEQIYKNVLKPIFFKMDPEDVHNRMTRLGVLLGKTALGRGLTSGLFYFDHPALHNTVAGIAFKNPVGLAAGFDKNAQLYKILPEIGFGHAELGSITGQPCLGNPRPRLFRLPKEKSILVNYGLYNKGAEAISHRLANVKFKIPIGFSVAKANDPSLGLEEGIQDYRKAYLHMHPLGAYTTINVSCPNTSDGITYQDPHKLDMLLKAIAKEKHLKPVFLKIKSDFTNAEPLCRRALKICESTLDNEHPEMVTSLNNLALSLHEQGDSAGAEPLFHRARHSLRLLRDRGQNARGQRPRQAPHAAPAAHSVTSLCRWAWHSIRSEGGSAPRPNLPPLDGAGKAGARTSRAHSVTSLCRWAWHSMVTATGKEVMWQGYASRWIPSAVVSPP